MTFHVGNLASETTRDDLLEAFRAHGSVASVHFPAEGMKGGRASGPHRGYAFVVMRNRVQGTSALAALDGRPLRGQAMSVRIAIPRRSPHYVH